MENFDTNKLISKLFADKWQKAELTIILPCKNEQEALPFVLEQIKNVIISNKLNVEIIISDSSTDNSLNIIKKFVKESPDLKIKLIKHNKEGYGNAYLEALKHLNTKYIFMADCDGTYDFNEIPNFLRELKEGNDLIIGNRFANKIGIGAMPWSNKYIGNPILSFILRLFYKTRIKDAHCGMRAVKTEKLINLNLKTTGMEFASEMIIKALKNNLKIKQLPIKYKKRIGKSKLNKFSDAWRHLRFMLLYSPLFLFLIPGIILFTIGITTLFWLYFKNPTIFGFTFYIHPMFLSSLLTILGYQLIIFAVFAKTYSITNLGESNKKFEKLYKYLTIEHGILLGFLSIIVGLIFFITILVKWINTDFGPLNEIKNSILALTLITIGIQTIFSSFMLSILGIREK